MIEYRENLSHIPEDEIKKELLEELLEEFHETSYAYRKIKERLEDYESRTRNNTRKAES